VKVCRLISGAELEMHRVARTSLPVASPFESSLSKYRNDGRVHVAGRPLLIGLRIEVNRNAPGVGRELRPGALRTKRKAAPKAGYSILQSAALNAIENMGENIQQALVAGNRAHALRMVPRQRNGKWQCDTGEKA
jgi:hypothetical protein